ncbi:hypothetical protein MNB_SUP05-SYMBIONT-5-1069 [hydrothermal vent metagenome]|uniref:Uncharacterized protein n=1 Tax=hydrothermal vent metagenome TaxID=652676 RepID=A0A1W1E186_9ZZZZ
MRYPRSTLCTGMFLWMGVHSQVDFKSVKKLAQQLEETFA